MRGTKLPVGVAPYKRVDRTAMAAVAADIRTGGTFEKGGPAIWPSEGSP